MPFSHLIIGISLPGEFFGAEIPVTSIFRLSNLREQEAKAKIPS